MSATSAQAPQSARRWPRLPASTPLRGWPKSSWLLAAVGALLALDGLAFATGKTKQRVIEKALKELRERTTSE